jgi:hypothetical protein
MVSGSGFKGSGFRVQGSAFSPAAGKKTAGLIEKETLKSEYRISNNEYRISK